MQAGAVVAADGRQLMYEERGDPGGSPVFFCHGTPGSRLSHHPDEHVYDGVRLIPYDRPGYGGSDPRPGRRVASVAEDIRAIADALGIERFGVFGISGGGPHALACAALLPDRVTRAGVMVGAAPSDDPEFDFVAGMAELNVKEFAAASESEEALAAWLAPFVEGIKADADSVLDAIGAELPAPDQAMLARPDVRAIFGESFREAVRQGSRGWIDDDLAFVAPWGFELAQVDTEVRLWQGELDVLVPRSHCEYLAERLPRATFEIVPGLGHLMLEHHRAALTWLLNG